MFDHSVFFFKGVCFTRPSRTIDLVESISTAPSSSQTDPSTSCYEVLEYGIVGNFVFFSNTSVVLDSP